MCVCKTNKTLTVYFYADKIPIIQEGKWMLGRNVKAGRDGLDGSLL